ncbi:hypothetical protein Tco_0132371 [Tanacetum coccineum]
MLTPYAAKNEDPDSLSGQPVPISLGGGNRVTEKLESELWNCTPGSGLADAAVLLLIGFMSWLETQGVSITGCHAGNPCELPSDLTANNDLPIIEELYGQDQKERGKQVRA